MHLPNRPFGRAGRRSLFGLVVWLSTVVVLTLAAACSSSPGTNTPTATGPSATGQSTQSTTPSGGTGTPSAVVGIPSTTVSVTERSFHIDIDKTSGPAGRYTFKLHNGAQIPHEFIVFKTDLAPDKLPTSGATVDENADSVTKVAEHDSFAGGSDATLNAVLQPGSYVFICNLPGHYSNGMRAGFTVNGPAVTVTPSASPTATATPTPAIVENPRELDVIERSSDIFFNRATLAPGDVTFVVSNETSQTQDFVVYETELPADGLPISDDRVDNTSQFLSRIAALRQIDAGATLSLTIHLNEGYYVAVSNMPHHYQNGMFIGFHVAKGDSPAP